MNERGLLPSTNLNLKCQPCHCPFVPERHQPPPSLKGQFCFIVLGERTHPVASILFSSTLCPPPILGPSSHYCLFIVLYVILHPLPLPMWPYSWLTRTPRPGLQLWGRVLSTRQRELSPAPAFSSSEQDTGTRVTSESFCSASWLLGRSPPPRCRRKGSTPGNPGRRKRQSAAASSGRVSEA